MSTPRVFISYSHDSEAHRDFVLSLSNRLRVDGLDCQIDQYVNGFPPEGWQCWMEMQVEAADFVLVVCTPLYLKRYRGLDRNGGRGVTFEGVVISQTLYDAYYQNTKFVPVLPEGGVVDDVPLPLKGFGAFGLMGDYEGLYRFVTGQPAVVFPEIGQKMDLRKAFAEDLYRANIKHGEQYSLEKINTVQYIFSFFKIKKIRIFFVISIFSIFFTLVYISLNSIVVEKISVFVEDYDGNSVSNAFIEFPEKNLKFVTNSNGYLGGFNKINDDTLMVVRKQGYYEWRGFVNLANPSINIFLRRK